MGNTRTNRRAAGLIITAGILSLQPAWAELKRKGLDHPVNHFPTWFSDANGTTLQLCLDGDGLTGPCLYDEPIEGNAFSEAIGFGPEAFWWSADAGIDLPDGGAVLVLALEAAFANEEPVDGDQFAFGRVRIRIDAPVPGEYRVWHPYMERCEPEVYRVETAGRRAINVTRDIGSGAPYTAMLDGEIGPFLVWDPDVAPAAPRGYVGDPQLPHRVVGSECVDEDDRPVNYFRIEGPPGADLDGRGGNSVATDLFSIQGKHYVESSTPPSVEPVRATYFRITRDGRTTGRVNLWAEAPPGASVRVEGLTQPNANGPLVHDRDGVFFRRAAVNATHAPRLPDRVTLVAANTAGDETRRTVALVDDVRVASAIWSRAQNTLKVVAFSSDRALPAPTLTLRAGAITVEMSRVAPGRYEALLDNVDAPPDAVTVRSSEGGADSGRVFD